MKFKCGPRRTSFRSLKKASFLPNVQKQLAIEQLEVEGNISAVSTKTLSFFVVRFFKMYQVVFEVMILPQLFLAFFRDEICPPPFQLIFFNKHERQQLISPQSSSLNISFRFHSFPTTFRSFLLKLFPMS